MFDELNAAQNASTHTRIPLPSKRTVVVKNDTPIWWMIWQTAIIEIGIGIDYAKLEVHAGDWNTAIHPQRRI